MPRTFALACLTVLLAGSGLSAQGGGAETSPDARRVDDRIKTLQAEATRLAGTARTLVHELRALEVERDLRAAQVAKADAAVAEAEAVVRSTDERLAALERERIERLPGLQAQLVDLYKRGPLGHAQMLVGAHGIRELGRASRTFTAMVASNTRRIEAHRQMLASVREERTRYQEAVRDVTGRRTEAAAARTAAQRAVAAHASRLEEIDGRRDLTAQYVGELQAAREALLRQLAPAEPRSSAVPLAPFRGALEWPVPGRLAGQFGQSLNRLGGSAVRNGIEIVAADGAAVHAVHGGTVAHADTFAGFGNLVILDHGSNHYSLYGYLGQVQVRLGQGVPAGATIGEVGPSPAGPPALYFELRVDGRSVDPVQWLKPR